MKLIAKKRFWIANGRTSRLLLNLDLMKAGIPPIAIKAEHRLAYYDESTIGRGEIKRAKSWGKPYPLIALFIRWRSI